jgi:hypothetical protein
VTYLYEPDEDPKRKHRWPWDLAGLPEVAPGVCVGKCPVSLAHKEAQAMLETTIPWQDTRWDRPYPQRLYAVRDGVLYRATPTRPGYSYHGFPEHPERFPRGARTLKEAILQRAREAGCEAGVKKWMNW